MRSPLVIRADQATELAAHPELPMLTPFSLLEQAENTRTHDEQMTRPRIEFWFDFSSAYAYFASLELGQLAARHDRDILWRPFMLGEAFRITGAQRLTSTPLKGDYARLDWQRLARLANRPFQLPQHHPSIALPAVRACLWLEQEMPPYVGVFSSAVLKAYFEDGLDTANPEELVVLGDQLGIPKAPLLAATCDPDFKCRAKERSEEAVARGIFGSPWFFVDGEPFWGSDRLQMIDRWLDRGGW